MLPWQHFCQGALGRNFHIFVKNGLFLTQNVFTSDFLVQIRNQRIEIAPCQISARLGKDKAARFSSWKDTVNYLMTSVKLLWLLRDFVPEYYHAKFGGNWTTNKYLLSQGYKALRLEKSFKKFYGRYQDLIEKYRRSVNAMVSDSFPGQFLFNM